MTTLPDILAKVADSTRAKMAEIDRVHADLCSTPAARVAACATATATGFAAGGRLFSFGNGGGSTDAEALAGQFLWPASCPPAAGPANVPRAFTEAHRIGMLTVGLAGYAGGAMVEAAARDEIEHLFVMPSDSVHRIQKPRTATYHVLWELTVFALGG